jgi:hypothetical protein
MKDFDANSMSILIDDKQVCTLYRHKKHRNYYLVENGIGRIVKMENANVLGKSKIAINLSDYRYNFPENISITHGKVPLDLKLSFIKR